MATRRNLFSDFIRMRFGRPPSDRKDLPIVDKSQEVVEKMPDSSDMYSMTQLNQFRTIAQDRDSQYDMYDEMSKDSIIAAALEIYADDATAYDEKGRVIWVESEDEEITKAGNRLLDILEIPERAWKHIYMACKYGDYYLKMYREGDDFQNEDSEDPKRLVKSTSYHVVNDRSNHNGTEYTPLYEEYVEDIDDPATVFDLRKKGKTAGFVQVRKEADTQVVQSITKSYSLKDVDVYRPDRIIHIMVGEDLNRERETLTLDYDNETSVTYRVSKGKSILYDVYPIQKTLQLLEDALTLNRLTRSSLIRILEIEVGDMPKKEVNNYIRRVKNLVEQHIALDKDTGNYQSFNAPGPVDNVLYVPVRGERGHISINNLGGDVNVRSITDIDYFNNKRAGALKIPRAYLGDDMEGSGLSNGGSLTNLSARYARTIKRIQTSYIRAITTMLNLFFVDKKLDYVNKFTVRMTSPTTQEDADRVSILATNTDAISGIMSLVESLEGDTQKKILETLVTDLLKMPEIATIIREDGTPTEDISIDGEPGGGSDIDLGSAIDNPSLGDEGEFTSLDNNNEGGGESGSASEGEFTEDEFSEFEDQL